MRHRPYAPASLSRSGLRLYGVRLSEERGLQEFMVRVGTNSGHVVGGGVGGDRGEYTVIGDAANMAARFEASAPPGGILIGESTFQLAGAERFSDTQAWEPIAVKGSAQPQRVHLVMRALAAGEPQAALVYSHKMADLAEAGGLPEKVARSRMYQGQAFTQLGDFSGAENELNTVRKIADQIGGIRLQWDVHAALEKLYRVWGQADRAEEQRTSVMAIVSRIRENLKDDDLKIGLPEF